MNEESSAYVRANVNALADLAADALLALFGATAAGMLLGAARELVGAWLDECRRWTW